MSTLNLDDDIHRLEGSSGNESGGLVIMKKGPPKGSDAHQFKKPDMPKTSILGLDRLAAVKRNLPNNNSGSSTPKRSKVMSYKDDEEDDVEKDDSDEDESANKSRHKSLSDSSKSKER